MKYLATHEPDKPLKWLADFLAQKSEEIEGSLTSEDNREKKLV
jgi:COMPASS component SDC1